MACRPARLASPDRPRLQHGGPAPGVAGGRVPRRVRRRRRSSSTPGQGVVRRLQRVLDPRELSGRHHRPHARRPLHRPRRRCATCSPWGEATPEPLLPVSCRPAAGRGWITWRVAISERAGFFDAAFDVVEYDPDRADRRSAPLTVRFIQAQHYVPAWGVVVEAPERRPAGLHRRHRTERRSVERRRPRRRPAPRRGAPCDCTSRRRSASAATSRPRRRSNWRPAPRRSRGPARPLPAGSARRDRRRCAPRWARGSGRPLAGLTVTVTPRRRSRPAAPDLRRWSAPVERRPAPRGRSSAPRRPGRWRSGPAPPDPARAGRPPGRRRRRPGGP